MKRYFLIIVFIMITFCSAQTIELFNELAETRGIVLIGKEEIVFEEIFSEDDTSYSIKEYITLKKLTITNTVSKKSAYIYDFICGKPYNKGYRVDKKIAEKILAELNLFLQQSANTKENIIFKGDYFFINDFDYKMLAKSDWLSFGDFDFDYKDKPEIVTAFKKALTLVE